MAIPNPPLDESIVDFLPLSSKEVRVHDAEKLRQDFIKSKHFEAVRREDEANEKPAAGQEW
jgi:hypothetical protein